MQKNNLIYNVKLNYKDYFNENINFIRSVIYSLEDTLGKDFLQNCSSNENGHCKESWKFLKIYLNDFIKYMEENKENSIDLIIDNYDPCYDIKNFDENKFYKKLLTFLRVLNNKNNKKINYIQVDWI